MKERPILFSAPMVRALLADTKTQTRRVASKLVRHPDLGNLYTPGALVLEREPQHVIERACPYGQTGDRLWVREAHAFSVRDPEGYDWHDDPENWDVIYRADERQPAGGWRDSEGNAIQPPWRPSIHLPRWASRITLEVTAVRVERLQDISEADAIAEGCTQNHNGYFWGGPHAVSGLKQMATAKQAYSDLWKSINGPGSWDANPWVWVVEFKRLEAAA